jgi:UPF0755 protein
MRDRRPVDDRTPSPKLPGLTPRSPSELLVSTRPPVPSRPARPLRRLRDHGEPRQLNGFLRFLSGTLTFLFLVLVGAGGVAVLLRSTFDAPGPLEHATVAVIPKGEGIYEIAGRLEREGIVSDSRLFVAHYLAARLSGGDKSSVKAGEYEIRKGASLRQVLETLSEGRAILYRFAVPEGLTSLQVVERLRADPNLSGEIAHIPPEGALLPDTYKFSRGMARQELLDRMQAEQQRILAQAWAKRQPDIPIKTPEQAMVLASIVEKETGRADERERVAAVFINRLRKGMRLQSDPTIIYGLVGGQGSLGRPISKADIASKTPYNTYQIEGLPPGPICNPGRASIEATLNPAKTADLYFVADGTGGHTFTTNLQDHNTAVANWRRIEREREKARPASAAGPAPAHGGIPAPSESGGGSTSEATTEPAPTPPAARSSEAPAKKQPPKKQ